MNHVDGEFEAFEFKYNSLMTRKMNYNIQSWPTKVQSAKFT